jgi:hypothetical protein
MRSLSTLVGWMVLVIVCFGVISGYVSFQGRGKSVANRERESATASRRDIQRYSARYIDAVRRSLEVDRDFLANYQSFSTVWNAVSPNEPMKMQSVSPAAFDSAARQVTPAVNRAPVAVSAENFGDYRLLLKDIRRLIVEADGTGRGYLQDTHFDAAPAEIWLPPAPAGRKHW